jgi:hypothetical protein
MKFTTKKIKVPMMIVPLKDDDISFLHRSHIYPQDFGWR